MGRGQARSDDGAGILLGSWRVSEMRRGADAHWLPGHDRRQVQLAGRTDAGASVLDDLVVVDIARLAGPGIVRPLQWYLGSVGPRTKRA